MTAKDAIQWAIILGVLAAPVAFVGWLAWQGQQEFAHLSDQLVKRGFIVAPYPERGLAWSARGEFEGHAFVVAAHEARGAAKERRGWTTAEFPAETGTAVVYVGRTGPDILRADGLLAELFLPQGMVPPRWTDAPAALADKWDVYATPADGAAWVTDQAVAGLLAEDTTGPTAPWIEVRDGHVKVQRPEIVHDEAHVLGMLKLGRAFLR
jgi:hypothetical protein